MGEIEVLKARVHKLKKKWKAQRNETAFFQLEKQRYKSLYQNLKNKGTGGASFVRLQDEIKKIGTELKKYRQKYGEINSEKND